MQHGAAPEPIRRLAALGGEVDLRLSRGQARRLSVLRNEATNAEGPGALGYRHGAEMARDILLLRAALLQDPIPPAAFDAAEAGAEAAFPIQPADLMPDLEGAALGEKLRELESRWIASGFALSRRELLEE